MRIRLDTIGSEPLQWREELAVSAAELDGPEVLEVGPVSVVGRISLEDPGFRAVLELTYRQTLACDRCLAPIEQTVDSEVRLLILVDAPQPEDGELELAAEDLEVLHLTGEELDTDPIIREQLQLNVPMRAICKDDCKGLCPSCGANRNVESCACEEASTDPRWETLRGWTGQGSH